MHKRYEIIDKIIAAEIYLYIVFMFLTKGEAVRNILIFSSFFLWLTTLKYRKNLHILKEPVSVLFYIFSFSYLLSAIFSIEPLYSFISLRNDPLKPLLLFLVISTVLTRPERLERAAYVCFITLFLIVSLGYYSYIVYDIPMLKPNTMLLHSWHNKFARYLNTMLPLTLTLYYVWRKKPIMKALLGFLLVISVLALILSTSRGGYISFLGMVGIYVIYLSYARGFSFIKVISIVLVSVIIIGSLSWFMFPDVRERMSRTVEELPTMNLRTEAWKPAFYAILDSPVFGWGHGNSIFRHDRPYRDTPYKKAPPMESEGSPKGPHNTFVKILFHLGFAGLIPYMLMIIFAISTFWKDAIRARGLSGFILIACAAILFGNFVINSMLADLKFRYMAVVLGLGMAAKWVDENSDT